MRSGESDSLRQDKGYKRSQSRVEQPFASPQQRFDLNRVTARLREEFELRAGGAGPRQEASYEHEFATLARGA